MTKKKKKKGHQHINKYCEEKLEASDTKGVILYYLKCLIFNNYHKNIRHTEKEESLSHAKVCHRKTVQLIKNIPEEAHILDLLDKRLEISLPDTHSL